MDTSQEAMKIANGIHSLIMSENPARGEKCKVDVDGGGDPEVMKHNEAQFGMSRFVYANGKEKGQWIFTVTVKAEYCPFDDDE